MQGLELRVVGCRVVANYSHCPNEQQILLSKVLPGLLV